MTQVVEISLYVVMSILTFMGLTYYWTKIKTPHDRDGYAWDHDAIIVYGIVQGALWPLSFMIYSIVGFFLGFFKICMAWIGFLERSKKVESPEIPVVDPYMVKGQQEVEETLKSDWAVLANSRDIA